MRVRTCAPGLAFSLVLQDLFLEVARPCFVFFLSSLLQQLNRPQKVGNLVRHGCFCGDVVGMTQQTGDCVLIEGTERTRVRVRCRGHGSQGGLMSTFNMQNHKSWATKTGRGAV